MHIGAIVAWAYLAVCLLLGFIEAVRRYLGRDRPERWG